MWHNELVYPLLQKCLYIHYGPLVLLQGPSLEKWTKVTEEFKG